MISPSLFQIKALPSFYAGVKFRSRLEARWARYFDIIGLEWQYEPEGYQLASGNYCPDFLCKDGIYEFFVEVKPNEAGKKDVEQKLIDLARMTNNWVFCVVGLPSAKWQSAYGQRNLPDGCCFVDHPGFGCDCDIDAEPDFGRIFDISFAHSVTAFGPEQLSTFEWSGWCSGGCLNWSQDCKCKGNTYSDPPKSSDQWMANIAAKMQFQNGVAVV